MSGFGLLAAIAVKTGVVAVALLVGLRVTGKRQAGEGNLRDLLLALMMANAVQNGMTTGSGRLGVALVSAGTLILLGWLMAVLLSRRPRLESWAVGGPTVIVVDGRRVRRNTRREGVTDDELMAAVHEQGLAGLDGVKLGVLELDGTISIIPREPKAEG